MTSGLSKIADSFESRGVISSNHRFVAFGAYGIFIMGIAAAELAITARVGWSFRQTIPAILILLSIEQVYTLYMRPDEEKQRQNLRKSLKFSQYGAGLWIITLYPWAYPDLNALMMAALVFQLSLFASLARFHVDDIRRGLVLLSALMVCLFAGAPSPVSFAMLICCWGFIFTFWMRMRQNLKSYKKLIGLGLASEEANQKLRDQQDLLFRESRTDQMTRIGNRRAFYEYCAEIPAQNDSYTLIAILDLDEFKQINDMHGHDAGDKLIFETANRMNAAISAKGRIFRLGGDEFAIIYHDPEDYALDELQHITEQALRAPVGHREKQIRLQWSMGVVEVKCERPNLSVALAKADKALYKAKAVKGCFTHVFTRDDEQELRTEAALLSHAQTVLSDGSIEMHGQPIYDIRGESRALYGIESLIRIKAPDGAPIRPDIFVRKAALAGETSNLSLWSLRKSVPLLEAAPAEAMLTFNLSPEQFVDERLCEILATAIAPTNFDPRRLVIELSERTLLSDIERTRLSLETLKKFGVKIALDDFGSENTGFSTLIDFDVDIIKTDPKLLMSALTNKRSAVMFQKIIELCDALDIVCIAEGVETLREFDFAQRAGCRFFQGYYFGRPALKPRIDVNVQERTMLDPIQAAG